MADRENALKTLHTRLHDSMDGYQSALERTESAYLKGVMQDMLDRRKTDVAEMHKYLTGMGIETSEDGSALAGAHRGFLKLKDAVTGGGDEAVLQEIVRGEDGLLSAYDEAIEAAGATDPEFSWLQTQRTGLKAKIEEFRARANAA